MRTLEAVAGLAHLTTEAMGAARAWALATRTKGTQARFRRMRDAAESFYERLRCTGS